MILISLQSGLNGTDLLIVLEDENLIRIKEHDNAEVRWEQLPPIYSKNTPRCIAIAYANPEEVKKIYELISKKDITSVLKLLTFGFKYRPDKGDHDKGPTSIIRP